MDPTDLRRHFVSVKPRWARRAQLALIVASPLLRGDGGCSSKKVCPELTAMTESYEVVDSTCGQRGPMLLTAEQGSCRMTSKHAENLGLPTVGTRNTSTLRDHGGWFLFGEQRGGVLKCTAAPPAGEVQVLTCTIKNGAGCTAKLRAR